MKKETKWMAILIVALILSLALVIIFFEDEEPPTSPPPPPVMPEFQATLVACDYYTAPNCTISPNWNLAYFEVFKIGGGYIQPPWTTVLIDVMRIDAYPRDDGDACFTLQHDNYEIWMPSITGEMIPLVLETGMGNTDDVETEWNVQSYTDCLAQGELERYHVAHLLNAQFIYEVNHRQWDSYDLYYSLANYHSSKFTTRIVVGN